MWDIKPNVTGREDYDFFETENEKYGIYFSDIDEYGMMKFVSPVQIWIEKSNPIRIFQSDKIKFEYQFNHSCYYFEKSNTIALLMPCYRDRGELF